MFVHCLLPAMLLLAIVDYATGDKYPYQVVKFQGRDDIPLSSPLNFYMKNGQCHGILKPLSPVYVKCQLPNKVIAAVEVTVQDYLPNIQVKIDDDLNGVEITRQQPCHNNCAIALKAGCA